MSGSRPRRELIDMAVLGPVPEFVRASVRLLDLRPANAGAVARLLRTIGRAAATDGGSSSGDPRTAAWRAAYETVGLGAGVVPPPEALRAWALEADGVPSLGPLPDLVNAFSLRYVVPVAAYDLARVDGDVWLRPARGTELFAPTGSEGVEAPDVGEIVLADDAGQVLARRWHGAQGREAIARAGTASALVHIDWLPPQALAPADLAERFVRMARGYLGGRADVQLLSRQAPVRRWAA